MQHMFSENLYQEKEDALGHAKFKKLPPFDPENPQCYFDICIGNPADDEKDKIKGRIYFEVFAKTVPKTAENFRAFCTGEKGWGRHFLDCIFHRIEPGKYIHGGDGDCQNGHGGHSIYGRRFNDENIWLPHTHRGLVTTAGTKENDNSS
jgi:hypothetical protein